MGFPPTPCRPTSAVRLPAPRRHLPSAVRHPAADSGSKPPMGHYSHDPNSSIGRLGIERRTGARCWQQREAGPTATQMPPNCIRSPNKWLVRRTCIPLQVSGFRFPVSLPYYPKGAFPKARISSIYSSYRYKNLRPKTRSLNEYQPTRDPGTAAFRFRNMAHISH